MTVCRVEIGLPWIEPEIILCVFAPLREIDYM